jgi:hypothetical protein
MQLPNEIVLRPRFKKRLKRSNESVLAAFEQTKHSQTDFVVSRVDDHVFIRIPKDRQHFWSPQLHLEIIAVNDTESDLFGLFGPAPTVWTLFMFLHFLVATLFLGFGVWAYSNYSLETSFTIQVAIMVLLTVIWFALYFGGKIGKTAGKKEMYALYGFMENTIEELGVKK